MTIGSALVSAVLAATSVTTATATSAVPIDPTPVGVRSEASSIDTWTWPLAPEPEVTRRFDPPDQPWLPGHRGVDLRAAVGQSVLAPAAGRVSWSGVIAGRSVVVVTHADGLRSTLEPVTASARIGTVVARRQPVGAVTSTPGHCAPLTCLHWGVLRGASYLDPLSFTDRAPVVLLPLG